MTPSIQIRFTRDTSQEGGNKDDVVTVEKVNCDWYYITYKDKFSDKTYTFQSTFDGFLDYLESALEFVSFDQIDPYDGVQFSIPSYPIVYCSIKRLRNKRFLNRLWKVLESLHNDWPDYDPDDKMDLD